MIDPRASQNGGPLEGRARAGRPRPRIGAVRLELRERTRARHDVVDRGISRLDLGDRGDFVRFLITQRLALAVLEPLLVDCLPGRPWPSRLGLLDGDLAHLEVGSLPALELADWGHAAPDPAERLGLAYVVAGSHLGLRVLRMRWSGASDARVLAAGRFMEDDAVARWWPALEEALEAQLTDGESLARAVESAQATFGLYGCALEAALALTPVYPKSE